MASAPTAAAVPITVPRFTVAMLDALPDTGHRYELLDGFLLVTPPPRPAHEIIAARLSRALVGAFFDTRVGYVVTGGGVHPSDTTYFQPDLLVVPASISIDLDAAWSDVKTWWLVVEVISPGSRVYDTTFKVDASLKLGVESAWLVDPPAREIRVRDRGSAEPLVLGDGDVLRWRPAALANVLATPIEIDVSAVFQGIGRDEPREEG
jgi:Uma2 family endonuclease